MAGTYGEPGKNEFRLKNILGSYSLVVNPTTKNVDIYQRSSQFQFTNIGTLDLKSNKINFNSDASLSSESKGKLAQNLTTFRQQSVNTATAAGAENASELLLGNTQSPEADRSTGQSSEDTSIQNGSGTTQQTSTAPAANTFTSSSESFREVNKYKEEFNNSFLKYPSDLSGSQDRIVISQRFYKSVIGQTDSNGNPLTIDLNTLVSERYNDPGESKILGIVTLPMPNDISETNVTAWGEDSLSTLAAMVGSSALKAGSALGGGNVGEALDAVRNALLDATGRQPGAKEAIQQFLSLNAAAAIAKKAGININPEAFRSRITGTAINPNMELLFQGPKLRSFGFQFKMTPRNKEEAKNIRKIIKFFKKGMAPKRAANQPFFLGAPNVFDINFKSGNRNIESIGKIKTCALQQCLVNYTPDGFYAAFNDPNTISQPIAVTMQLTFTELTPLYNDNYNPDTDSTGYDGLDFQYDISPNTGG
jgi:hypothetical protein